MSKSSISFIAKYNVPTTNTTNNSSPHSRVYAEVLRGIENPFAQFLRSRYGVEDSGATSPKSGRNTPSATDSYLSYASDDDFESEDFCTVEYPSFEDRWASAFAYRYRPTEEADEWCRADPTLREIIEKPEPWIKILYENMLNTENCLNRPESHELAMFKSSDLDLKEVEAACRATLTGLVHRCVVGFCGLDSKNQPAREDRKLTCKERLQEIAGAFKIDKRICKDVLLEDAKIVLLVHGPKRAMKAKKSQQRSNDRKRTVLQQAAQRKSVGSVVSSDPVNMVEEDKSSEKQGGHEYSEKEKTAGKLIQEETLEMDKTSNKRTQDEDLKKDYEDEARPTKSPK